MKEEISKKEGSQCIYVYDNDNKTIRLEIDGKRFFIKGHFHQIEDQPDPILYV